MGFITSFIYIVLSLITGIILVGTSNATIKLNLIIPSQKFTFLSEGMLTDIYNQYTLGLFGMLIILFALRYIQTSIFQRQRRKSIKFESEQGNVEITLFAIEEMVKKLLEKKKEISHIRPKVTLRKTNLEVKIQVYLASNINIIECTKDIQEEIKEKIYQLLGEGKEIFVRIEIKKVIFNKKVKNDKQIEDIEPTIPFRNY